MKVYISYHRADLGLARRIIDFYEDLGLEVLSLPPAERNRTDFARRAEELIERCDLIVFIVGRSSLRATWRELEQRAAVRLRKAIIPIVVGELPETELPSELQNYQLVRVSDENEVGKLVDDLWAALRSLLRTVPRPLQAPDTVGQPPLTREEQILAFAPIDRRPGNLPDPSTLVADTAFFDEAEAWAARRLLARSIGRALGQAAVIGGLIALGYLYWDKLAALFGVFLNAHQGTTAAFPAASGTRGRPRSASHDAVEAAHDLVECCVFAPVHVRPRERIQIQVPFFNHDEIEKVAEEAKRKDPTAVQKRDSHVWMLQETIQRGSRLSVSIDGNGLIPLWVEQCIVWRGAYCFCEFWLDAPDGNIGFIYTPEVKVFFDSEYIGSILFRIPCVRLEESGSIQPAGDHARGPQPIFLSYSSKDFREVRTIANAWRALRLEFFQDAYHLGPGAEYPKIMDAAIDRAKTFCLIWTHNSKRSKWCKREYDRALARRNASELRLPVIIPYGVAKRRFPWLERTIPDGKGFLEDGIHIKLPQDPYRIVGDPWWHTFPRALGARIAEWTGLH
jgi:hypothetical protein